MYLFAGRSRHSDVASFLKEAEAAGKVQLILKEFDIERSPDHDLTDAALWEEIHATLKEGPWFLIVSPPCNTFSRARFQFQVHPGPRPLRSLSWPKGFPWLKASHRKQVDEANAFVIQCIHACRVAVGAGGHFLLEHPEDLGAVNGERPGSIWQWPEILDLISFCNATCFAIHQCAFGAATPKPTRLATDVRVDDNRCFLSMPIFDAEGFYVGPLPRDCGHFHEQKLIGKAGDKWKTGPSAAYPADMCQFIAGLILKAAASCGGGVETSPPMKQGTKRKIEGEPIAPQTTPLASSQPTSGVDLHVAASSDPVPEMNLNATPEPPEGDAAETYEDFDLKACGNTSIPILVEWDNSEHSFVDGFGLCSPTRWKPKHRGKLRTQEMVALADKTFGALHDCVVGTVGDVKHEAFRLVTGKICESPFSESCLSLLRDRIATFLPDAKDAVIRDEGQPFFLRLLDQWLKVYDDPDTRWLVDEPESFASGVCLGVDKPLPRSPQVFPMKSKHRKLDETEFKPIADNYQSAQLSVRELEDKFREEEGLGRMHPSKLGVLKNEYGDRLRIASMAAISKPDGSVRPLHDATHSVMVNHEIKYQDRIMCPGPSEIAGIVREAHDTGEAPFCVSADIKAAHRLVKVRKQDWGYMCCRADSNSDTVWVNHTGTFGVSSAPYWWAKLAALLGRFVGYLFHDRWFMQMIYVDDLHGVFVGPQKYLFLWIWVLAFEMIGTPFGYHKFKGGPTSEFIGYHIRYDTTEVGIVPKRGDWLVGWILKAKQNKFVVQARDFVEFLGRLGFVSQVLVWMKPHLSPLFAWAAVVAKGTVGKLPEAIIITLRYIQEELQSGMYMISTRRPLVFSGDQFRTDAKCADGYIVVGGWELVSRRWFAVRLLPSDVPFLFKPGGESQWASTSAELLASLFALEAFGWLKPSAHRKSLTLSIAGGTDNRANEALTIKRATTKWPLMAINMQMSSSLARARLLLSLAWRPREENVEADDLTNENFTGFDPDLRVSISLADLDLAVLWSLVDTRREFDTARELAREVKRKSSDQKNPRRDKTPW